jgi:hypothetical protein
MVIPGHRQLEQSMNQLDFFFIVKEEDVPSLDVAFPVMVVPSEEIVNVCFPGFIVVTLDGPSVIFVEYEMTFPSLFISPLEILLRVSSVGVDHHEPASSHVPIVAGVYWSPIISPSDRRSWIAYYFHFAFQKI